MTLAAVPPTHPYDIGPAEAAVSLGKITTRPSVTEDSAFMLELYASTSKEELDHLGWSIGSQRTFVIMQAQTEEWNRARLYPGMDRLTICVDGFPVGRLLVCLRNNILHLVDLSLLPRYRGVGIGTQLLSEIVEEARNARVPVKVRVLKDSRATRFVDRLGFGSPTDLGDVVELTWMPPLTAVADDAREEGFHSTGTRANRRPVVPGGDDTMISKTVDTGDWRTFSGDATSYDGVPDPAEILDVVEVAPSDMDPEDATAPSGDESDLETFVVTGDFTAAVNSTFSVEFEPDESTEDGPTIRTTRSTDRVTRPLGRNPTSISRG